MPALIIALIKSPARRGKERPPNYLVEAVQLFCWFSVVLLVILLIGYLVLSPFLPSAV